jgi:hypothetical protein
LLSQLGLLGAEIEDFDISMPSLDDIYRFYSSAQARGDAS